MTQVPTLPVLIVEYVCAQYCVPLVMVQGEPVREGFQEIKSDSRTPY